MILILMQLRMSHRATSQCGPYAFRTAIPWRPGHRSTAPALATLPPIIPGALPTIAPAKRLAEAVSLLDVRLSALLAPAKLSFLLGWEGALLEGIA